MSHEVRHNRVLYSTEDIDMRRFPGLALAAALGIIMTCAPAAAQTVIVRSAPQGATIEARVNELVKSATADASGDATIPVPLPAGTLELRVRGFVDACGATIRVYLTDSGISPPFEAGCNRTDVVGLFIMRSTTTFVIDMYESRASLHLTQGNVPRSWLDRNYRSPFDTVAPQGLVVFAGTGGVFLNHFAEGLCASATTCAASGTALGASGGIAYWFNRFVGAQITFAQGSDLDGTGTGSGHHFENAMESKVMTITGNASTVVQRSRVYAMGGLNYHQATFTTIQTVDDRSVSVDGAIVTIPGGTQTLEHKTAGWNWMFGGGLEVWLTKWLGFYGEFQTNRLHANDIGTEQNGIDDQQFLIMGGVRLHLGLGR